MKKKQREDSTKETKKEGKFALGRRKKQRKRATTRVDSGSKNRT